MKFAEFKEKIEGLYMEKFNQSMIECKIYRCLGKSITIDYTLAGNSGECTNGIYSNDMLNGCFMIHLPDNWNIADDLPENLTMKTIKGSIRIKPEFDYLYCSGRKLPFRKTTGSPEKLISTFGKFVERLREAITEEYRNCNLLEKDMELVRSKCYAV